LLAEDELNTAWDWSAVSTFMDEKKKETRWHLLFGIPIVILVEVEGHFDIHFHCHRPAVFL
jgi:hypothetical protein